MCLHLRNVVLGTKLEIWQGVNLTPPPITTNRMDFDLTIIMVKWVIFNSENKKELFPRSYVSRTTPTKTLIFLSATFLYLTLVSPVSMQSFETGPHPSRANEPRCDIVNTKTQLPSTHTSLRKFLILSRLILLD